MSFRDLGFPAFVGALVLATGSASGFELGEDEAFTGLSMSHDGETVVIATTPSDRVSRGGALSFIDVAERTTVAVPTPEGILPHNPEYGPDPTRVLYSGYCLPGFACEDDAEGWNLFVFDQTSGETTRVTQSKPGTVRWDAIWGENGEYYVTEFEDDGNPFSRQRRIGTTIAFVAVSGKSIDYFPVNEPPGIGPMGSLERVELLQVQGETLVFYGRVSGRSRRPTSLYEGFLEDGQRFDERLVEFVDREFYDNIDYGGSGSPHTLFELSKTDLSYLLEYDLVQAKFPNISIRPTMVFLNSSSDSRSFWSTARTFDDFSGHLVELRDGKILAPAPRWFWGDGELLELDAAKDQAVGLVKEGQDRYALRFFDNWDLDWDIPLQ